MSEEKVKKLTQKEDDFCFHYVNDVENMYNGTQAALSAGYSQNTAGSIASENLKKPHIRDRITELIEEKKDIFAELREKIIAEYKKIAFTDIKEFVDLGKSEVSSVTIKDLEEVDGSCIESIKETKDGISFKLHDKHKALEKLGQYVELFEDDKDKGNVTIIIKE